MISVKQLKQMATGLKPPDFRKQLGPFVLIQRPPTADGVDGTDPMGVPAAAQRTVVARPGQVSGGMLSLLFGFDDLVVATLPPLHGVDELSVGRQPDCDLVIDDPSVSKRHAILRWDAVTSRCTIQDLQSTNGTFLNAAIRLKRETTMKDGDILSFGEVQYWFVLTPTLLAKLTHSGRSVNV